MEIVKADSLGCIVPLWSVHPVIQSMADLQCVRSPWELPLKGFSTFSSLTVSHLGVVASTVRI